jgi:hypothetical protein
MVETVQVAGYPSWDKSYQRPFKRAIRTRPTWVPQKTIEGAPRHSVKSVIQSEQDRIAAVRAATKLTKGIAVKKLAEHPINVLALSIDDRKLLLEGPKTSIIADGNVIIRKGVPTRALMASCQKVHDTLHVKPRLTQFRVYGKLDLKCIETLLDIFTISTLLDLNDANLTTDSFDKNVLMYQAILALGIHYDHTLPLLNSLRSTISSRLLTTSELDSLTHRISSSTHPLFKHLANDLCHRRFKRQIPDVSKFEQWLSRKGKEGLKKSMIEVDQKHRMHRQAVGRRQCDWRGDRVLARWGEDVDGVYAVEEKPVEEESEGEDAQEEAESQSPEITTTPAVKGGRWGKLGGSLWG